MIPPGLLITAEGEAIPYPHKILGHHVKHVMPDGVTRYFRIALAYRGEDYGAGGPSYGIALEVPDVVARGYR